MSAQDVYAECKILGFPARVGLTAVVEIACPVEASVGATDVVSEFSVATSVGMTGAGSHVPCAHMTKRVSRANFKCVRSCRHVRANRLAVRLGGPICELTNDN